MTRCPSLVVAAVLLATCALLVSPALTAPPGHQPEERAAVLAAMDRYLTAISERDLPAMAVLQTPDGMSYQGYPATDGDMEIKARPFSHWIDPAGLDERVFRERYWSPTVLVRGGIAVVWAPYEFWIDGETSHCGVDIFNFVKIDGRWLVAGAMWTVEPDACDELRPEDVSELRPAE